MDEYKIEYEEASLQSISNHYRFVFPFAHEDELVIGRSIENKAGYLYFEKDPTAFSRRIISIYTMKNEKNSRVERRMLVLNRMNEDSTKVYVNHERKEPGEDICLEEGDLVTFKAKDDIVFMFDKTNKEIDVSKRKRSNNRKKLNLDTWVHVVEFLDLKTAFTLRQVSSMTLLAVNTWLRSLKQFSWPLHQTNKRIIIDYLRNVTHWDFSGNNKCMNEVIERYGHQMIELNLSGNVIIQQKTVERIGMSCPNLKILKLRGTVLTNKTDFGTLSRYFRNLEYLDILNTRLENHEISSLLEEMQGLKSFLFGPVRGATILNHLKGPLTELYIDTNRDFTEEEFRSLIKRCPLETIHIRHSGITDGTLINIGLYCKHLKHFYLTGERNPTEREIVSLLQVIGPGLKSLGLIHMHFSNVLFKTISTHCTKLHTLELEQKFQCLQNYSKFNKILYNCTKLRRLNLTGCVRISSTTILMIAKKLRKLNKLRITYDQYLCNMLQRLGRGDIDVIIGGVEIRD